MADSPQDDKNNSNNPKTVAESSHQYIDETTGELQLPPGWMYKRFKIGPFLTPWYASPKVQLGMVAFVCFLCPGMFNALSGLGGGGRDDTHLADNMVIILHMGVYIWDHR